MSAFEVLHEIYLPLSFTLNGVSKFVDGRALIRESYIFGRGFDVTGETRGTRASLIANGGAKQPGVAQGSNSPSTTSLASLISGVFELTNSATALLFDGSNSTMATASGAEQPGSKIVRKFSLVTFETITELKASTLTTCPL